MGNDIADRAAKLGCKLEPTITIGITKDAVKERVTSYYYEVWNNKWREGNNCRETKLFMPSIDGAKGKKIMALNKRLLSVLVRHITGHAHLHRHRRIMGAFGTNDINAQFESLMGHHTDPN